MEIETTLPLLNRIFQQHFNKPLSHQVNLVATLGEHLGRSMSQLGCLLMLTQRIILFLVSVHGGRDQIRKLQVKTRLATTQGCQGTALFHIILEMIIFRAALFWPRLSDTTKEQVLSRMTGEDSFGQFLEWFVDYAVSLQRLNLDDVGIQLLHAKLALSKQNIVWRCDEDRCYCTSAVAFTCAEVDNKLADYWEMNEPFAVPEQWPDFEDVVDVPVRMAIGYEHHFLKPQLNGEDDDLMATLFSEN